MNLAGSTWWDHLAETPGGDHLGGGPCSPSRHEASFQWEQRLCFGKGLSSPWWPGSAQGAQSIRPQPLSPPGSNGHSCPASLAFLEASLWLWGFLRALRCCFVSQDSGEG